MSWAARITSAPGVELRVVFSEPVRQLDMTRDTARKLAGLILVAASQALAADPDVKPLGPAKPVKGERRNPTGTNQHTGESHSIGKGSNTTLSTGKGSDTTDKSRGATYLVRRLKRDAPQPKTAMNVSGTLAFKRLRELPKAAGGAKKKRGRPEGSVGGKNNSGANAEIKSSETRDDAAAMLGVSTHEARDLETVFTTPGVPEELKAAVNRGEVCCCIVTRWERQENRGCPVHVAAKSAPAGVLSADVEPKTRRAASRPNEEARNV